MKLDRSIVQKHLGKKFVIAVLVIFSLVLFAIMYHNVHQKHVNLKEGQLAEETIRANKTIENKYETEEKRKLAAEAVTPEYSYDSDKGSQQIALIEQLFDMVQSVSNAADKSYQEKLKDTKRTSEPQAATAEDKIATLKGKFEKLDQDSISFYQKFSTGFYESLFNLSTTDLKIAEEKSVALIETHMKNHIRNNTLKKEKDSAVREIDEMNIGTSLKEIVRNITDTSIVVNEVANQKKTDELKKNARNNVNPVMIYQGEIVVREGVQLDSKAMQKLELLGMTSREVSFFPVVALACAILMQLGMFVYVLAQANEWKSRVRCVSFYALTMLVSILIMEFLQYFQTDSITYLALLFPAAFCPLVLSIFINRITGIMAAIFQVVFALFIYYDLIGTSTLLMIVFSYLFTGVVATVMKRERIGSQLGVALAWLVGFPIAFVVILSIYQGFQVTDAQFWSTLVCALVGEILTFLLSIGLHPYIELVLNDDSIIVLNELSNPNQPLLKRLLEEAPGTYHHSMMVASLSANAVAEIGGRSLLTRVACYYHDIGKIKHANFFVENLPAGAENPHNFLLPEDSKEIIFGHVTEGAKILEKEKMPQMVIDVCRQHHGKTLMKYFFVKAQERDPEVKEEDFRYPGPKPQTREAGVINIADSAEAAVRAMDHPTNEKIKAFVHNLVQTRIEDGQLDESGLTLNEIRIIEKSIVNGLCSTFHSRIKYPKMKSEAEKMKEEQEKRG